MIPGHPMTLIFFGSPPTPRLEIRKKMEVFDGRTFVQDGGRLRWQAEPDGTQQVLNRRFWR